MSWRDYMSREDHDYIEDQKFHAQKDKAVGKLQEAECSVKDVKGNHCPEKPNHFFKRNDEDIALCQRCYDAYVFGAYGKY